VRITAQKVTATRNAHVGDLSGLRGAPAVAAVDEVMRQDGCLVKNSFEEAFSAWADPKLTHLGAEIEHGQRRLTQAELTKFGSLAESREGPPRPPVNESLDLEFEGCSFVIVTFRDEMVT
jgi:hypothetical protein